MIRRMYFVAALLPAAAALAAEQPPVRVAAVKAAAANAAAPVRGVAAKNSEVKAESGAKALSGISILGNQETPKALVIVPWKSSQLGDTLGISQALDDSRLPVDREVFMRELSYYQIRSASK